MGLCDVVEEYGLVSFLPLAIQARRRLRPLTSAHGARSSQHARPCPRPVARMSAAGVVPQRQQQQQQQQQQQHVLQAGPAPAPPSARPQERESLARLVMAVDKANGYCFATMRSHTPYSPEILYGSAGHALGDKDLWLGMQVGLAGPGTSCDTG